jgi:hypothetical protein
MFMGCRCGQTGLATRTEFGAEPGVCLDPVTVVLQGWGSKPSVSTIYEGGRYGSKRNR